jgi:biofilm PGA synthesis N-glycosyltransferase PgaC
VSGVVACFRKAALHDVGYWSPGMLTEDIDISWKLQIRFWDVRFEPKAQCWILAPETLRGLWQQRLRWSTGGMQVLIKNWRIEHLWKNRRMWPVLLEYVLSVVWAYTMFSIAMLWLVGLVFDLPPAYHVESFLSGWNGVMVGTTCLLQVGVSLSLDARYDTGSVRTFFWMIWYPLAYWMFNMMTTIVAAPRALLRNTEKRALWTSPDRGILP